MKLRLLLAAFFAVLSSIVGITASSFAPAFAAPAYHQQSTLFPTTTPYAEPADVLDYWILLHNGLQGMPQIQTIDFTDNRQSGGNRLVSITYVTSAATAQQRVNEWMVILVPLGDTLRVHQIDVDQIELSGVTKSGALVGVFTTIAQDLLDFSNEIITRAEFLNRAKYTSAIVQNPTQIPAVRATAAPSFNEADYVAKLTDGLFIWAGGRRVETIRVADGRAKGGERSIIISYTTTETTDVGYIDEMIDLFDAVAITIRSDDLDVDSVALVAGDAIGQAVGIIVASVPNLMLFHDGQITRSAFIRTWQVTTF